MSRSKPKASRSPSKKGRKRATKKVDIDDRLMLHVDQIPNVEEPPAKRRPGRPDVVIDADKKEAFLFALSEHGLTVGQACEAVGASVGRMFKEKDLDKEFAAAWDQAYRHGCHVLEAEARRRAIDGVTKPIFYKGVRVSQVQEYSDVLLIFLMKARVPEVYRDRVDVSNSDGSIAAAFAAAVRRAAS